MQQVVPLFSERESVDAIRRRFMAINRERLRRAQGELRERQRDFVELLPLLFHVNHPALPGYISNTTPVGISDYTPTARALELAKKIARDYDHKRRALAQYDIFSLFLIGSTGTIAHSRKSDFDIWVCHDPGLTPNRLQELEYRARALERWALELDMEVHFFLMTPDVFKSGKQVGLSTESSGSAQHYLLLEEFYRTGLLLAGRYLAWWLVPPEHEDNYDIYLAQLRRKGVLREAEYIDFGGIPRVPAEEFFGAALWHLYKGVDSPYKSVLKLLLAEIYAAEYPASDLLCLRYKNAIYQGEVDLSKLDPYMMLYQRIEEHLVKSNNNKERLELVRRCFYFKVNERLSLVDRRRNSWRRDLIHEMVKTWGWDPDHLAALDAHGSWKIDRVMHERRVLVSQLTKSYQALSDFARNIAQLSRINQRDLNILGRKLYAAFERKPGKVEVVNRGISKQAQEPYITVHQFSWSNSPHDGWALFLAPLHVAEGGGAQPIRRAQSVVELLAWCHLNDMIGPETVLALHSEGGVTVRELKAVTACFQRHLPVQHVLDASVADLEQSPRVLSGLIFVNLGAAPLATHARMGLHLTTAKTDSLSYGGIGENLAVTFDQIIVTSWKEVLTYNFSGLEGLVECLGNYLQWAPPSAGTPPPMTTYCFSSGHGDAIGKRLEELFQNVAEVFYGGNPHHVRYVFAAGQGFYILWMEGDKLAHKALDSYQEVLRHMAQPHASFVRLVCDRYALVNTPLSAIFDVNQARLVQLFYQISGTQSDIYVLDENGSLHYQRLPTNDANTFIPAFTQFFTNVIKRRGEADKEAGIEGFEFYQVVKNSVGGFSLIKRHPSAARAEDAVSYITARAEETGDGKGLVLTLAAETFSARELGANVFRQAAAHAAATRPLLSVHHPLFVTDLDLARSVYGDLPEGPIQTIHFLNYKRSIEQRLYDALVGL